MDDRYLQLIQVIEISIAGPFPSSQFPYPFNGVQLWAVWREVHKFNFRMGPFPLSQDPGMMVMSVVQDKTIPSPVQCWLSS